MTQAASHLARHGPPLLEAGYPIVPIKSGKKHPGLNGWQKIIATPELLEGWLGNGYASGGVAVLASRFPGVDLDVRDEQVVTKLVSWCHDNIGYSPRRIGEAPKTLLPYSAAAPFKKIASPLFKDANGLEHKVEILGDGQQYVCYANHPDTGKPYEWPDGHSLIDFQPDELPALSEDQARDLVAYFLSIIPEGWSKVGGSESTKSNGLDFNTAAKGFDYGRDDGRDRALELLRTASNTLSRDDWVSLAFAAKNVLGDQAREDWLAFSSRYAGAVKDGEAARVWDSARPDGSAKVGKIFYLLQEPKANKDHRASDGTTQSNPQRQSKFFSAADLKDKPVSPREWKVHGLIPMNTPTLFSGDGGAGKSQIALQLAIASVAGLGWLNRAVTPGRAIFLSAEDDEDELHRRTDTILRADQIGYDDLSGLTLRSVAGEDALLAVETGLNLIQSELFNELDQRAADENPDLIIIDTAADVFPANENDRAKVRQFIGILRGLALKRECAVVLLSHPSLTGLNSGTGTSGSTAWNNSVRSRLYLERIIQDGYEPDPDARRLSSKKANYARTGGEIMLRWQDGVFVAEEEPSGLDRLAAGAKAERVFLNLLHVYTEQGRRVSPKNGPGFAPKIFAEHPDAEGCTKKAFKVALETLLRDGKVQVSEEGPPSRRTAFLELRA